MIKKKIQGFLKRFPYVQELQQHRTLFTKNACFPPGHFYSPIVSVEDIQLFVHYLHVHHKEAFADLPLTYRNYGGNFWVEKK